MQTFKIVRSGRVKEDSPQYLGSETVYSLLAKEMRSLDREHFIVLHLDLKNRLLARETISIGSLNETIVHPREVFKAAVINGSAALLLAHNHPSGNPLPSNNDINVTARLEAAGEILGIRIYDHLIFGDRGYYSFAAAKQGKKQNHTKEV